MSFFKKLFSTNRTTKPKPVESQQSPIYIDRKEKNDMMDCPPFPSKASCSDNDCPCNNTTMPPAQGYLWIKPEVVKTRINCLSMSALQNELSSSGISGNIDKIRSQYLPIVVCKVSATRRKLDLKTAETDYNVWVKTAKVPCRATPIIG
jgi:hypothetical protein